MLKLLKKLLLTIAIAAALAALPSTAFAQSTSDEGQSPDSSSEISVDLFSWYSKTEADWGTGIFFAILGAGAALTITYFVVGSATPGTSFKADFDFSLAEIENAKRIRDLSEAQIDHLNQLLAFRRRRSVYLDILTAFLYVVLGAFFASMLAKDFLQALLVGASWTSFVGALGLKADASARGAKKDDALSAAEIAVEKLATAPGAPGNQAEIVEGVLSEIDIARRL